MGEHRGTCKEKTPCCSRIESFHQRTRLRKATSRVCTKIESRLCYIPEMRKHRVVHKNTHTQNKSWVNPSEKKTPKGLSARVHQDRIAPKIKERRVTVMTETGRCTKSMNEARLSHLPFWGPSEAAFFLIKRPSG